MSILHLRSISLTLLLSFAGCCRLSRPDPQADLVDGEEQASRYIVSEDEFSRILVQRQRSREADQNLNVLILSGGAQNGAFGAGVLKGWLASQTNPKPGAFDIVKGISTGA